MKRLSLATLFALPVLAFAAAPQISDVAFGQVTPGKRTVTVRYLLTGAPAVVTMDVQTNGVSIGAANVRYLSGDVNRVVQPDAQNLKTILWDAERSWPDQQIKDNSVTVKLTAWSLDGPPPYMLVDLSGTNGISYHASTNDLPFGPLDSDVYRTDYMLLRRIDAAGVVWTMGYTQKTGDAYNGNAGHDVTFLVPLHRVRDAKHVLLQLGRDGVFQTMGELGAVLNAERAFLRRDRVEIILFHLQIFRF